MDFKTKFILGTAQFGSNYGIANFDGTVKKDDAINIIELMKKKNMKIIDTASSYHESEKRLGEIGVQGFDIISKLPFRNSNIHDLESWIEFELIKSLKKLKIQKLYAILIHDFDMIDQERLKKIFEILIKFKNKYFYKIGISTYLSNESLKKINLFPINIIQTSYNIFDRKIENSDFKNILNDNIEIHARSIFLQGVLVNKNKKNQTFFSQFDDIFDDWFNFLSTNKYDPIDYCIKFVLSNPSIDKVVLGIDNFNQFKKIFNFNINKIFKIFKIEKNIPEKLINPTYWN